MTDARKRAKARYDAKNTMINVTYETRDELKKLGTMEDSYDSLVRRMLAFIKENQTMWLEFEK
jgi:hypothetical protein